MSSPQALVNATNWSLLRAANIHRNETCYKQCLTCTPWDWAMMVYGEMGEVINAHRKHWDELRRSKVEHELADVVISCDILANSVGFDLAKCKILDPDWWGTGVGLPNIGDPAMTMHSLQDFIKVSRDLADVKPDRREGITAICAVVGVLRITRRVADHLGVVLVNAVPDTFNRRSQQIGFRETLELRELPTRN